MFRYIVFSVLTAELIFFSNGCQSIPGSDEIQSVEVGDNLVAIGGQSPGPSSNIEVIDLKNDETNCYPQSLPYKVYRHSSVYSPVLKGVVTCGGNDETWRDLSKCILISKCNDSTAFPSMSLKRNRHTLTSISNYIFAIGGFGTNTRDIGNMEIINLETDHQWSQRNMPFSVYSHCTVALGNNIIVTGGKNEDWRTVATTWIYNIERKTWSKGPNMNQKRSYHACLADQSTSSIHVMGGFPQSGSHLSSTETWVFGTDSWKISTNLPERLVKSVAVPSNSEEYVGYMAGGWTFGLKGERHSRKIWALKRQNGTWIEMSKKLRTGRRWHSLVNVPALTVLGC